MKLINSLLLLPALFAATTLTGIAADSVSSMPVIQKRSHAVRSQTIVDVKSDLGDVIIRSWDEDRVIVRSEAVHADVKVSTTDINGCVTIEVITKSKSTDFTNAVHVVYVPKNATVRLLSVTGEVTIEDVHGDLRVIDNRMAVELPVVVEATSI